jgi:hypothetical protein
MLAPFIAEGIQHLDLSEENMFNVGRLIKALYYVTGEDINEALNPGSLDDDQPAEQMMAYFLYVIKDALEYAGFAGNRAKNAAKLAARELKMALARFDILTQKSQWLSKVQANLEQ